MKINKYSERNPLIKLRKKSLNRRLIFFVLFCWVVPILVFFTFATFSYQEGIVEKSDEVIATGISQTADLLSFRIDEAIDLSQKPSYEKVWEWNYNAYKKNNLNRNQYIQTMGVSLSRSFGIDSRFSLCAFYEIESDTPDFYKSQTGQKESNYLEKINSKVLEIKELQSNYVTVKIIDQRIFIIRNLYTVTSFKPFATLVVELNKNRLVRDIDEDIINRLALCINEPNEIIAFSDLSEDVKREKLYEKLLNSYNLETKNKIIQQGNRTYNGYMIRKEYDRHDIALALIIPKAESYASLYRLYDVIALLLIMFLPVMIYIAFFLRGQIRRPVSSLVNLAKEVEKGNFGYKISSSMPNAEFKYLMDSFNSMSLQVKYLFDYVYSEQLAKKDAQILALQAQINPHFLNNTLEMMNWQARMSGDIIVSKMIEALGTVLNYRINRSNVKEIYLVEELKCVDAYFYIMSMRFGQRLQVTKEIDEELLYMNVPPLILQPLIENAIVHGVEKVHSGTICLQIYHDKQYAYLMVKNSGKEVAKEEYEKINLMLSNNTKTIPNNSGKHISIGIRNVNQRLKLVYGEKYGLTIYQEGDMTVSKIVLPYKIEDIKNTESDRKKEEPF